MRVGAATVEWTNASHGNLGHNPPRHAHDDRCCGVEAEARRRAVHARPWHWLEQVHGAEVAVVDAYSAPSASAGDALVTTAADVTLAVATADCGPLALVGDNGVVGAVHAGWKGLRAGVVEQTVDAMRQLGASSIEGALGPCIHVECNEFGVHDLTELEAMWGAEIRGLTRQQTPALDLPRAIEAVCFEADVKLLHIDERCTACSGEFFSHRANRDWNRQVMLVWQDAT